MGNCLTLDSYYHSGFCSYFYPFFYIFTSTTKYSVLLLWMIILSIWRDKGTSCVRVQPGRELRPFPSGRNLQHTVGSKYHYQLVRFDRHLFYFRICIPVGLGVIFAPCSHHMSRPRDFYFIFIFFASMMGNGVPYLEISRSAEKTKTKVWDWRLSAYLCMHYDAINSVSMAHELCGFLTQATAAAIPIWVCMYG